MNESAVICSALASHTTRTNANNVLIFAVVPISPSSQTSARSSPNSNSQPWPFALSRLACSASSPPWGSGPRCPANRTPTPYRVPARFLVQILLQLKEAGLVNSVRGAAGGYLLIKPPRVVSLGQVRKGDGLAAFRQPSLPHISEPYRCPSTSMGRHHRQLHR